MTQLNQVWVFAENQTSLAELVAGAAQLGKSQAVIVVGDRGLADVALSFGVESVYYLGDFTEGKTLVNYFASLSALLKEKSPDLMLVNMTKNGRLLSGTMAAALGTSVLTDTNGLSCVDGKVQSVRMVYGGAALRKEQVKAGTAIACVGSGVFETSSPNTASGGKVIDVPYQPSVGKVHCVGKRSKAAQTVNLPAAKRVVGVGRGFGAQEELQLAQDFAKVIQAEVGCSRPIAEGEGWMPKELYIGVSGAMLKADIYFALGISGQIQHMVGVNQSRVIIAVNKDKNAPIFKQADYGIVGDVKTVLPALQVKLQK